MRPHVGLLIPAFLDALTVREDQTYNYLSTRLDGSQIQETLDDARIASSRNSQFMKTINKVGFSCALRHILLVVLKKILKRNHALVMINFVWFYNYLVLKTFIKEFVISSDFLQQNSIFLLLFN